MQSMAYLGLSMCSYPLISKCMPHWENYLQLEGKHRVDQRLFGTRRKQNRTSSGAMLSTGNKTAKIGTYHETKNRNDKH